MDVLNISKKACFTGYRPEKFSFKLNSYSADYNKMISRIMRTIESLIQDECKVFYCGMAMGFDIICAECVLKLREKYSDISLVCVVPYEMQGMSFPSDWQQRYKFVLKKCDSKILISQEYSKSCFQERNKYMVDNSDFIICWYDGKSGGTRNTINYAKRLLRTIININVEYNVNLNNLQTTFFI